MSHGYSPRGHTESKWTRPDPGAPPRLIFHPAAFLKLLYFLRVGNTEIGGYGVAADTGKGPFYITDFCVLKQKCTLASVEFDDDAVADHMVSWAERGVETGRTMRVWIHTHPEMSANPSGQDEETFATRFGSPNWAVMFIYSKTEQSYCRLRFKDPEKAEFLIGWGVDWASWDGTGIDREAWAEEYKTKVEAGYTHTITPPYHHEGVVRYSSDLDKYDYRRHDYEWRTCDDGVMRWVPKKESAGAGSANADDDKATRPAGPGQYNPHVRKVLTDQEKDLIKDRQLEAAIIDLTDPTVDSVDLAIPVDEGGAADVSVRHKLFADMTDSEYKLYERLTYGDQCDGDDGDGYDDYGGPRNPGRSRR